MQGNRQRSNKQTEVHFTSFQVSLLHLHISQYLFPHRTRTAAASLFGFLILLKSGEAENHHCKKANTVDPFYLVLTSTSQVKWKPYWTLVSKNFNQTLERIFSHRQCDINLIGCLPTCVRGHVQSV